MKTRICFTGLLIVTSAFTITSCFLWKIDKNLCGRYDDVSNPRNRIEIYDNGVCPVTANGSIRKFRCSVSEKTITMKLLDGTDEQRESFEYPEFRGTTATLTIDGNTLITQTGKRFSFVKDPHQGYTSDF